MSYAKNNYHSGHLEWIMKNVRADFEKGELWWKIPGIGRVLSKPIGFKTVSGYMKLRLEGYQHSVHRVLYAMYYGKFSEFEIDHINRNPNDNRIINLREVLCSENTLNRGIQSNNTTGLKGVTLTRGGRYLVRRCKKNLGTFKTKEEALNAYLADERA